MNTEALYKVVSGSGNTIESATEILTKAVNVECGKGWIRVENVTATGISRNGEHNLIQVVAYQPDSDKTKNPVL